MSLEQLFCEVDDFCLDWERYFSTITLPSQSKRTRKSSLYLSEIMTIIINFHRSRYRTFKDYYTKYVLTYLRQEFPNIVSYNRFVELMPSAMIGLLLYLNLRKGKCSGINFIDSTCIPVCHPRRAKRNKVFKDLAGWGRNSVDWYFGFKLHLIINERGEILAFKLTPGNVDDRKPVPDLTQKIFGKLFGDKGYISQKLWQKLWDNGLKLITPFKKNMKNKLLPLFEKILLRKRALIETVNDQLKNISQIAHTRHRSVANFLVNLVAGLIAYTYQEKKPSLKFYNNQLPHNTQLDNYQALLI